MTKLRIVFDITPITSKPVTGIGQIIENLVGELSGMENVDLVPFALTARANLWQLKMRYPKLLGPQIPARLLRTAEYLINSLHVPLDIMIGPADAVISVDWFCPRLMHGKTVAVIADCTPVTHPQWYDTKTVKRYKTRLKTMERDADLVVAISQATRKALLKHTSVIKSNILVAYPGLPKSFSVYPSQQMMTAVRVRYGLPEEYLLFVGSENPRKNLTGLVNAMGKLKIGKGLTLPPLVVAGDEGWGATKYPSYIIRLGYVPNPDLPPLMAAARGLLYPSIIEGFGLPIIEAFAMRTPVVTGDTSSMVEIANGAAILVDPESDNDIVRGINLLLMLSQRERSLLVSHGYERLERFSFRKMAETIVKAIER